MDQIPEYISLGGVGTNSNSRDNARSIIEGRKKGRREGGGREGEGGK